MVSAAREMDAPNSLMSHEVVESASNAFDNTSGDMKFMVRPNLFKVTDGTIRHVVPMNELHNFCFYGFDLERMAEAALKVVREEIVNTFEE